MKKWFWFLLLMFGLCMLITGCSSGMLVDDTVNSTMTVDTCRNTENQLANSNELNSLEEASELSTDHAAEEAVLKPAIEDTSGERQYEYNLNALEELPSYTLQELFEFYRGADGAFSEGAMAEMMERLSRDPSSFLSALVGAEKELQTLIADHLGTSIFFVGLPEYSEALYNARDIHLDEQQSTLLECIIMAYEASVSSLDSPPIVSDEDLVNILDYIPSIYVDLKYAAADNFTGIIIYDFMEASLRYGTVKKLAKVQDELLNQGYSLKIWDAYRPVSAQFKLWEICPDPTYVANPNTGYSSHSRGSTVDVTMVMTDGTEIAMPSRFDEFSALADRNYSDVSDEAAKNALILENTMTSYGFNGYSAEWWHYSDNVSYPVIDD